MESIYACVGLDREKKRMGGGGKLEEEGEEEDDDDDDDPTLAARAFLPDPSNNSCGANQ